MVTLPSPLRASGPPSGTRADHAIAIRTTETVTEGGWVWILEQAKAAGITRIDVLVKQDEDDYYSQRTDRVLQSGELLVALPGEVTAEGWEDSAWLEEMLVRGDELGIEIWAWWPVFHDSVAARAFPEAGYTAGDGSVFVDAAVPAVRNYQTTLLTKLLETYAFDGISLDWIRYDTWPDGGDGPLAEVYRERTGQTWSELGLRDPLNRAIWGDIRETSVASWLETMVRKAKARWPEVAWGGYLLPPQFKEVSQDYAALTAAGLEAVQPMIYWSLWHYPAVWSGEVVGQHAFWAQPDTKLVPTLDLNRPDQEHMAAAAAMRTAPVSEYLWYLDTAWTERHFKRVRTLAHRMREARAQADPHHLALPDTLDQGPTPARFPPDSTAWTLVLFAALHDQGLLAGSDPIVPVLALHRFTPGPARADGPAWSNSAGYVRRLFRFLDDRGFSVIPLRDLQAAMLQGYAQDLPAKAVVLTVDDAAQSVARHFHPLAVEFGYPYTLSVITRPLNGPDAYLDEARTDPQMDWDTLEQLADSDLVQLVSHSHALHTYVGQGPEGTNLEAAAMARRWLADAQRTETDAERFERVRTDLARSRAALESLTGARVTVLAWPYGRFDRLAERAARAAGFRHFLLFGGSRYAKPAWAPHRIGRIPVGRGEEGVALSLPEDPAVEQAWWLAYLTYARHTAARPLIEAVLLQLDDQAAAHPEAVLARAALDVLAGRTARANVRIARLGAAYPEDRAFAQALQTFRDIYRLTE
ncbi:polysaccharide deacetylase family protein [uncultured Rhodospira sp.]|uniref:polysaccharide deacetylase family protein n=1 Tax=uncultured Rhodospira sp. TaxID=1936189 RepID=UPI002636D446|nr:polysaccharide deacetylase family protein [uncultured Rhodospira sp.]